MVESLEVPPSKAPSFTVGQTKAGFHLEEDRELVSVILWDSEVTRRDWKHKVVGWL